MTRFSPRGILVNLEGTGRGGDAMSVQYYVDTYCMPRIEKKASCIPIAHIANFPLQIVVSTIVRVAGSSSLHLSTRTQMRVTMECLQGTMFDWCLGVISIMKKKLLDYRRRRKNNFSYMSILVALIFFQSTCTEPYIETSTPLSP